jgi:RNA polymerase sigma factor (sigma-70 family)
LIEYCRREAAYQRLPKADEEDCAQEALTAFLMRAASVENPLAYLKVVVRRIARSLRQAGRRNVALNADFTGGEGNARSPSVAADSRIEASRLLALLSPRDRRFALLASRGYTFAEIGELLGVTGGSVRIRIFRLRKKLSAAA